MTELQKMFEEVITSRNISLDHAYDVLRAVCFVSRKYNDDWHKCVEIEDCYSDDSSQVARAFMDAAIITLDERSYSFGLEYSNKASGWGRYLKQDKDECLEVLDLMRGSEEADAAVVAAIEYCSDFAKFDLPEGFEALHLHKRFRDQVKSRFIDYTGTVTRENDVWTYFVRLSNAALGEALIRESDNPKHVMDGKVTTYVQPALDVYTYEHEWLYETIDWSQVRNKTVRTLLRGMLPKDKLEFMDEHLADKKSYFERFVLMRRWLLSCAMLPQYFGINIIRNQIERVEDYPEERIPKCLSLDNPKN